MSQNSNTLRRPVDPESVMLAAGYLETVNDVLADGALSPRPTLMGARHEPPTGLHMEYIGSGIMAAAVSVSPEQEGTLHTLRPQALYEHYLEGVPHLDEPLTIRLRALTVTLNRRDEAIFSLQPADKEPQQERHVTFTTTMALANAAFGGFRPPTIIIGGTNRPVTRRQERALVAACEHVTQSLHSEQPALTLWPARLFRSVFIHGRWQLKSRQGR